MRGGSAIIGPDGRYLVESVCEEPRILPAELDPVRVRDKSKALDAAGHRHRLELFEFRTLSGRERWISRDKYQVTGDNQMRGDADGSERDEKGGATYLPGEEAGSGFPPGRTVLLVIDPVNDFLSDGGAAWDLTRSTVEKHNVVGNLRRAIEGARERGIPVFYGPMAYTEEDYATMQLHRRSGINRIMYERKMFLAGSWGADFHPELQPRERDVVLLPHKGTDVFETDLSDHLGRLGATHLVIAGMTANLCCDTTGRHAMEKGYDVTFLSDAIGSDSLATYEAAVRMSFPFIGNAVMEVEEFLAAADASVGAPELAIRAGDLVKGSDHLEIGTVKEVVGASDAHEPHLRVSRGVIFHAETYVPLDAVVKRAEGVVFVNVPSVLLPKLPWDQPPTQAERREKQGPPAGSVERLYRSRSPSVADNP